MTEDTRPFQPYDIPGSDGLPTVHEHKPGIPVFEQSRKLAKDVVKMAKLRAPKMKKLKLKSDVKWY